MNPGTSIPAPRGLITGPNVRHQALILLCAPTHRALAPGIEPTPGNVEHPTQDSHRIDRLLRLDEAISHPDALAKKATVGSGGACNSGLQYSRRRLKPQRLPWTLVQA